MEQLKLQNVNIQLKNGKMDDYYEVLSVKNDSEYITITQINQYDETVFYRRNMEDVQGYAVEKC